MTSRLLAMDDKKNWLRSRSGIERGGISLTGEFKESRYLFFRSSHSSYNHFFEGLFRLEQEPSQRRCDCSRHDNWHIVMGRDCRHDWGW